MSIAKIRCHSLEHKLVSADARPSARTFLQRDYGKAISGSGAAHDPLLGGLLRDAIADLGRKHKDALSNRKTATDKPPGLIDDDIIINTSA
jgi:hypothetical protein